MELRIATCPHCQANLEIAPGRRFITCARCLHKLRVVWYGEMVAAEPIIKQASIEEGKPVLHDRQRLKLEEELKQLDKEWNALEETYDVSIQGVRKAPNPAAARQIYRAGTIILVLGIVIGIFFNVMFLVILGLGSLGAFIIGFMTEGRSDELEEKRVVYREKRRKLEQEISFMKHQKQKGQLPE